MSQPTKPLTLTAPEAAEFHRAGRVERRRKVRDYNYYSCLTGDCPHCLQTECDAFIAKEAPHATGTECWVREGWAISGSRLIDPCLNYRADGAQVPMHQGEGVSHEMWWPHGCDKWASSRDLLLIREGWQRADTMPRWASRATARCAAVDVRQIDGVWMWVETWERTK